MKKWEKRFSDGYWGFVSLREPVLRMEGKMVLRSSHNSEFSVFFPLSRHSAHPPSTHLPFLFTFIHFFFYSSSLLYNARKIINSFSHNCQNLEANKQPRCPLIGEEIKCVINPDDRLLFSAKKK